MTQPADPSFPVASLDRIWRAPSGGRRVLDPRASVRVPSVSSIDAARAKLRRIVERVPQVMVKVSGRQQGADHVTAHFAYIGRHGDLEVETEDGERLRDPRELADRAAEWDHEDGSARANGSTSISMVLSMPAGTDAMTVLAAARAFARVELEGRHRYMLALHDDTDHPHVHVTVAVAPCELGGARFNPRKADLHRMRETFAHELRERGIEADATPRRARGITRRTDNVSLLKLKQRYAMTGGLIEVDEAARRAGRNFAASGELTPWERAAIVKQQQVKKAYGRVADQLAGLPDESDRALGRALRAYVDAMPAPFSRRLELAAHHARDVQRYGGDTAAAGLGMFRQAPSPVKGPQSKSRGARDRD
ncbi:relaxase/mobilization nuclease domain-containing protein [Sphingomonas crocodyli]|uniref:Plasmid stabilization protein n=1 Tax=Sphingomonas crocodyli TaxID=1979270 RepID=A0A437LYC8_9SPHN|nr:relaxase/mobilization nuclease domain-containing protein [Sphingomonas crocodyli]RVT90324.1 plasmid stabilization protein [Sphingomonas crocodyli]